MEEKWQREVDALGTEDRQAFKRKLQELRAHYARRDAMSEEERLQEDELKYAEYLAECRRTGEHPVRTKPSYWAELIRTARENESRHERQQLTDPST